MHAFAETAGGRRDARRTRGVSGNLRLVKEGEGTFVGGKSGQKYGGGTVIAGGTARPRTGVQNSLTYYEARWGEARWGEASRRAVTASVQQQVVRLAGIAGRPVVGPYRFTAERDHRARRELAATSAAIP